MTLIFSNENRILFDAKITDQLLSLYYGNRFTPVLDLKNFYRKQKRGVSYKPSLSPRGVAFSSKKLLPPGAPFKARHVAFLEKKLRKETKLPFNNKLFDKENNYKINLSTPFLPKLFAFSTTTLPQKGVQKKLPRRALRGKGNFLVEKASKGVKNFYNTSIRNFFHQTAICKLKSSKKGASKYCFSARVPVIQRDQHIDKPLRFTQVPITNNKFQLEGRSAHLVGTNQRLVSPFTDLLCKSYLFNVAKERNTLSRSVSEVFLEKKRGAPLYPSSRALPRPRGGKRCSNLLKGVRECKERQLVPPLGHGNARQKEGPIRFSIKKQIKKNVPEAFFTPSREGLLEVKVAVRKAKNQKIYTKILINNYIDFLKEKVVLALLPLGGTLGLVKFFFLKSVPFKFYRAQSNTIKIKIWSFAFGSTFFLISITSILKKQEKNSWLFPFLKTQMPGLYQISQESSLESFENITSKYINRTDFASKVVPQLALQAKQGFAARALLGSPLEQSAVEQSKDGERSPQAVLIKKQSETKDGLKKDVNKAPNLIKNINFYRNKLDIDFSESWNQQQIQNFKAIFSKSHFYVPVPKWFLSPFRSNFLILSTKKLDFQEPHSLLKKLHRRLCAHGPVGHVKRNQGGEVQRVKTSKFCFSKGYEYSSLEKRLNKKKGVLQKKGNDFSYEIAGLATVSEKPLGVAFFQKASKSSSPSRLPSSRPPAGEEGGREVGGIRGTTLLLRKQKNAVVSTSPKVCCAFDVLDGAMRATKGKTQRGFASTNNGIKSNCLLSQPWYELNARIAPKTFITKNDFKKVDFSEKNLPVPKLFCKKSYVTLSAPWGEGNESAESGKKEIEKAKQKKSTLFQIEKYKKRVNVENDSIPSKMECSIEKNKKIHKNFINASSKILKNFFYKYGNFSIPDRLLQESTEKEEVKRAEEEEIKFSEEKEVPYAKEEEFLYDLSTSLNNLVQVNDLQHLVFSTSSLLSRCPCLPLPQAFYKKGTPKSHRGGTDTAGSFFGEKASKKVSVEGEKAEGFHKPKVCELSFATPIFKSNLPTSLYRLSFNALNFDVPHGQKLTVALLPQDNRKTVRVKKRYTILNRLPIDKISSLALDKENSINNRLMSGYQIPEIENLQLASKNKKKVLSQRALYNGTLGTFFEAFSPKKLPFEDIEKAKTKTSTETQLYLAHMNNVHIKIPPALPFYASKINNFFVGTTTSCRAVPSPLTFAHRCIPRRRTSARARAKIAFRSFFSFSTKKLPDSTCVRVPETFCKKATLRSKASEKLSFSFATQTKFCVAKPSQKVFGHLKGTGNSEARQPKGVEKKAMCPEPPKGNTGTAEKAQKGRTKKSLAYTKEGGWEASIADKTNYHVPVVNRKKYIEESEGVKQIGKEARTLNESFQRFLSNNKNRKGNTLPPIKALKKMPYKKLSLKCLQEVKPLFEQVNQEFRISPYRFSFKTSLFSDYNDYLSWQKDTPAAISISPSFEEDKAIEDSWNAHIEKENLIKEIERENLTKEQENNSSKSSSLMLQTDQEDLHGNSYTLFTEGVEASTTDSQRGMGNFLEEKEKRRTNKVLEETSPIVDEEADEEEEDKKEEEKKKDITTFEWLLFIRDTDVLVEKRKDFPKLAYSNKDALFTKRLPIQKGKIQNQLVKDRKDSFFGITNLFPKRLIAQDQKQINDQILQEEHDKRSIALFEQLQSKKDDVDTQFSYLAQDYKEPILVEQLLENGVLNKLQNRQLGKQAFLPSKDLKENLQEAAYLQKKALYANKIFISKEIAPRNRESNKILLPYLEGTTNDPYLCASSAQRAPLFTFSTLSLRSPFSPEGGRKESWKLHFLKKLPGAPPLKIEDMQMGTTQKALRDSFFCTPFGSPYVPLRGASRNFFVEKAKNLGKEGVDRSKSSLSASFWENNKAPHICTMRDSKDFSKIIKAKLFSCLSSRQHPIYTPNLRLRLRLPQSSLSSQNNDPESFIDDLDLTRSHKWWQKRRIASSLLGAPSKRYLAMPELTAQDWRKIIEWQLKTYFLEEEKRIGSLVLEKGVHNTAKNFFKLKKIAIYLPWTTLKKSLKKPFEWPLTSLSYQSNYKFSQDVEEKRLNLQKKSFALPSPYTFAHRICLPSKDSVRTRSIVKKERNFLQNRKNDSCFVSSISPQFKRSALSCLKGSRPFYRVEQNVVFDKNSRLLSGPSTCKDMQISITKKQLQKNSIYKPFLFEQVTEHSHLLLHQLLLAVTIKQFLYSIYKVFGKVIVDRIKNSSLAIAFLPLFFNNDSRFNQVATFYALKKRFKDLAGSEHTISSLSEIVWYLRNSCRGRMVPRGVVLVESVSAESTDFLKAIGGEAQVPVIVQSLRALPFTQNHPQRRLEKVLTLAQKKAPCILFLDDLDAIGQSRTLLLKNNLNYRKGLRTRVGTAHEAHNKKGRNSLPHFLFRSNLSLKSTASQWCVAKPTPSATGKPSVLHNALLLPSSSLKETPRLPFYFASQKVASKGSKERQGKTSSPLFGQSSTLEKKKWKRFKNNLTNTFHIEDGSFLSKSVVQNKRTSFNLNVKKSVAFSTLFLRSLYAFSTRKLPVPKMALRGSFFTKSLGYKKSYPFTENVRPFGDLGESVEKVKNFGKAGISISKAFKSSSAQPRTKVKKVLGEYSSINRKSANTIFHTVLLNNLLSKNLLYRFKSPQKNCKSALSRCKRKSFATKASLCNIGAIFLNSEEGNFPNRRGRGEQPRNTLITNTNLSKTEEIIEQRRVDLMLRLLTVMDGITHLNGVLIVTTSKNPSLLDPALLRPGRFERLINLKLPNKKRRIELLKVQTSKIGYTNPMPWEYFGTRTKDMTGTEIASAINHSAFRAIIQSTAHTAQTLEYGISCVNDEGFTSYPFEFSKVLSTSRQSNFGNKIARSSLRIVRYARPTKSKSLALESLKHLEKPKLYSIQREIQLKGLLRFRYAQQKFVTKKDLKSICVHNPYKPFLRDEAFTCSMCRNVPCRALIPFRKFGASRVRKGKRGRKLEVSLFNKSTKNKIKNNFRSRAKKEKPWNGVGKIHYHNFRKYLPFGQNNNPNYFFSLFNKSNRDFLWSKKIVETLRVSKLDSGNWYRLYLPRTEQNKNNREWLYPDKFFNQHISLLNINTFCPSLRAVPHKVLRGRFFLRSSAFPLRGELCYGPLLPPTSRPPSSPGGGREEGGRDKKKVTRSFFCTRSFFTKSYSEGQKGSNFFFPKLFYKKLGAHTGQESFLQKATLRSKASEKRSFSFVCSTPSITEGVGKQTKFCVAKPSVPSPFFPRRGTGSRGKKVLGHLYHFGVRVAFSTRKRRESVEKAKSYSQGVGFLRGSFLRKRSFPFSFSEGFATISFFPSPFGGRRGTEIFFPSPVFPRRGTGRRGKALLLRKAKKKLYDTFAQRRCARMRHPDGVKKNSELSYYKLLLSCSYMSFQNCTENRELLDLLADHLIRFKLLRLHEIIRISSFYVNLNLL